MLGNTLSDAPKKIGLVFRASFDKIAERTRS